jgi:pectate lyase
VYPLENWNGLGTGQDLNTSRGAVFEIPYEYTAMPTSEVFAAIMSPDCGAGNTCTLAY